MSGDSTATITLAGQRGLPGYNFSWGAGVQSRSTGNLEAYGLPAGTFQVTITDANNCSRDTVYTVTQPATNIALNVTTTKDILCKGDSTGLIQVQSTGGTGTHTYLWNDYQNQTDNRAIDLPVGAYQLVVTDSNGCKDSISHTLSEPVQALSVSITQTVDPLCATDTIGSATVTANGGTGTYTYLWNDNHLQNTAKASSLLPGAYQVTVTDANGCFDTAMTTLTALDTLDATFTLSKDVFCNRDAQITLSGGPNSSGVFAGSGVSGTNFNPQLVSPGQYVISYTRTLRVCTAVARDTLLVNANPVASLSNIDFICNNTPAFTLNQGLPKSGIYWGTQVTGDSLYTPSTVAANDTIYYEYTDANGCKDTTSKIVEVNSAPTVAFASMADICLDTVPMTLSQGTPATGVAGTGVYSGTGVATGQFFPAVSGVGTHTLNYTYTDTNQCSDSATTTLTVNALPILVTDTLADVCVNGNSVSLNKITPAGGVYSGSAAVSGTTFDPAVAGVGSFQINYQYTDGNGCEADTVQSITVRPKPVVTFSTPPAVCVDVDTFSLNQGLPFGGYYRGAGVQGDSLKFYPKDAGTGSHTLTYVSENVFGCIDSITATQVVDTLPVVGFTQSLGDHCVSVGDVKIGFGFPASAGNGIYSGNAITADTFNTLVAQPGDHAVRYTFTDNNGCTSSVDSIIHVDTLPVVSMTTLSPVCADEPSFGLTGGNPVGGSFNGNGVTSGQFDAASVGSGNYTINYTYTDGNGCVDSANQMQVVNPLPVVSLSLPQDTFCQNESASILSGGAPSGGSYYGDGVFSGTFFPDTVTVGTDTIFYTYTNNNGCTAEDTNLVTVKDIPHFNWNATATHEFCISELDYTLDQVDGKSGTGQGWYLGSGVIDSAKFRPDSAGAGTHNIQFFYEDNGCINDTSFALLVKPLPIVTLSAQNAVCSNGISFNLSGGTPVGAGGSYSGPGVSSGVFDPAVATAGTHTITYTYTDPNSNCVDSASSTIEVYAKPVVLPSTPSIIAEACSGDGIDTLRFGSTQTAAGGSAFYLGNGVTDSIFDPVLAGTGMHQLQYIHVDSNSCSDTATVYYRVNPNPVASLSSLASVCTNDGYLILNQGSAFSLNGNASEEYSFTGPKDTTYGQRDTFHIGLYPTGNYQVTYRFEDNKGCADSSSQLFTIHDKPSVAFDTIFSTDALGDLGFDLFCNNTGGVILTQGRPNSGGTGTYFSSSSALLGNTFYPQFATPGVVTLNYMFTDQNNCSDTVSRDVRIKEAPEVILTSPRTLCASDSILNLDLDSVTGGLGYGMYSGTGVVNDSVFVVDSAGIGTHLIKFHYYDTTHAFACVDSASRNISVRPKPTMLMQAAPEFCLNDRAQLSFGLPGGGLYLDSTGTVIDPDSTNYFDAGQFGEGKHKVFYQYTDQFGCTDTLSDSITVLPLPEVTLNMADPVACIDENTVELNEGLPAGGSYNGSGIFQDKMYTVTAGVGQHIIQYTYTDSNWCSNLAEDTLTIVANPVFAVSPDISICKGQRVTLGATGLGARSVYSWSNGVSSDTITVGPAQTTQYQVMGTDSNNCSSEKTVEVIVNPSMVLVTSAQDADCGDNNGAATVSVNGGLPPYNYFWTNGSTTTNTSGLPAGIYQVTVTDDNSCTEDATIIIKDKSNTTITLDQIVDPLCHGSNDGSINITINGSASNIAWSNGETTEDVSGLTAGKHIVSVIDEDGCQLFETYLLGEPDPISIQTLTRDPSCGSSNGLAVATAGGGAGGFNYNWTGGSTVDSLKNAAAGIYTVTVIDANNCEDSIQVALSDSGAPNIDLIRILPTECKAQDGEIEIVIGTDTLQSLTWTNGDTTELITQLAAGQYEVTATDTSGCKAVRTYEVEMIDPVAPEICMVTYDTASGYVTVLWNDLSKYENVRVLTEGLATKDLYLLSTENSTTTMLVDSSSSFAAKSYTYALQVEDSCGQLSEAGQVHRSMYLNGTIDQQGKISLEWSHYVGAPVGDYEIYRVTPGGGTQQIGTVAWPIKTYEITRENFEETSIRYFVRAALLNGCDNDPFDGYTYSNFSADFGSFNIFTPEVELLQEFRIYPNPTNGAFFIEFTTLRSEDVSIEIMDSRGRMVFERSWNNVSGAFREPVDLTGVAVGVYQLRVKTDGELKVRKIQVQK
ncbi:T9SS type A sorting domain-containing protein [bacterium SCSIO 12741]|nr:T9SS type A sorting domain-containing protein [bacterium SCSIO 12741]